MKTCFLAGVGLLACGLVPAVAADLGPAYPIKAASSAPEFSWTGFHVGAHAGYAWGDGGRIAQAIIWDDPHQGGMGPTPFGGVETNPSGWFGGLQAGYDHQFANRVVLGVEADIAFGSIEDSTSYFAETFRTTLEGRAGTRIDTFGTARLRLGYAFDRFLPYVTGGLAWGDVKLRNAGVETIEPSTDRHSSGAIEAIPYSRSAGETRFGWTVGAGAEYAFDERWSVRAEYLYANLGTVGFPWMFGDPDDRFVEGASGHADITLQTVKLGINFRF